MLPSTVTVYEPVELPVAPLDAQLLWKISDANTNASGRHRAMIRRRSRPAKLNNNIARISAEQAETFRKFIDVGGRGWPIAEGGNELCPTVVTDIVAAAPCVSELGVAEHWLIGAVLVQDNATLEEKSFSGVTLMAFLYTAVCPARTDALPLPITLSMKSGVKTEKLVAADAPPPGAGFETVTGSVPAVATFAAGMAAVSIVELRNVVETDWPLKLTVEPALKFDPLTVSVNAPLPMAMFVGEMLLRTGNGLLTVKFDAFDVPPSGAGFVIVMAFVPAAAMLAAGIAAVSDVALMNVVGCATPSKFRTAPDTKFDPVTVSVNAALPATALAGANALTTGGTNVIVKVTALLGL